MTESCSIMRFIADHFNMTDLYPTDLEIRHKIDSAMDYYATILFPEI